MPSSGEIKIFLIADIRGYTRFTNERGDDAGARLASRFAEIAAEGIEGHDGSLIELRGDEALAVFTSPRQALRAAVELQNRFVDETTAHPSFPLRVGIGMDAGEAVKVKDGYRGEPLNVAARLCGLAAPGEVLASQEVVHLARRVQGLRLYEQGPTRLKGLDRPVTIIKVAAETANPYKGLRAFDEADAPDFFGREALIEQLVERLSEEGAGSRFLAVVGPSGSGKSSVVRAGLVPALRRGALPGRTKRVVAVMVPGEQPMLELGAALRRVAGESDDLDDLLTDPAELMSAVARVLSPRAELILVIDQFEELFTLVEDEELREGFIEAIRAAVLQPKSRLRVILTLRADFYDRPLLYRDFGDLVGARTQTVTPLSPHELELAISGPAARAGVALEPGLVSQIVADVSSDPGALPLLQYALTELFEGRSGNTMTLEAYREIGGVSGALVRRAEDLYKKLEHEDRDAARQLFLRLATTVNDVDVTRRRVPRAEILSVAGESTRMENALDAFGAGRFLSFDRDPSTALPTVEVAHEALLVEWSRLRGWLESAQEDLRAERRLAAAAREWIDADRDPSFLVTGSRLERFEGWRESSGLVVTPQQEEFLVASRVEWERLQAEEELREARERALERRTLRRTRALVAVLAVAAVVAAGLTFLAFNERRRAEREARTAVARELAAASVANLEVDPERSVLLAIEAIEVTRSTDGSVLPEAEEALHRAVTASRIELSIRGAGGTVDWSPEGIFVTEETDDTGVIDIRDASTGETVRSWKGHGVDVNDVAFSPDGSMLATTGDDKKLKLWDPTTGRLLKEWTGKGDDVWGPSFSANGSRLSAAWATEGVVRVVDPDRGRALTKIQMEGVRDTGLSPNGSRIVASSEGLPDATVFDVESGKRLFDLSGHEFVVLEVAWSPNGRFIATSGIDGTARVFEARTGEARFTLTGHNGNVWDLDWSDDSKRLVTGAEEGTVIVWEISPGGSGELFRLSGQGTSSGASVALSPDGEKVVTGSGDFMTTQIWDLGRSGDAEWANFPVEGLWDGDVAFMPDNRRLMATRTLTEIALWDTKTGRRLGSTKAPPDDVPGKEWFQEFDLSPDGAMVASAGVDGNGQVWDPVTGEPHFIVDHRAVPHEPSGSPYNPSLLRSANWSAEGGHLVTASHDGSVKITDASGHHIRTWRAPDEFTVPDAALSPDARFVAISSLPQIRQDQEGRSRVTVREVETGDVVTTIKTEALEVAFDPTGTKIATADEFDGIARIWDARSGERLLNLAGHSGTIVDLEFSPDGKVLATGGFDGTARLFDVAEGVQRLVLRGHTHAVYGLAFSPDGTKLATESADGTARVWALDLDDLLEIARDQVTRSLTEEECRQYLHLDSCPT